MRNLKRALSLVMAAAMLVGMMVVGASAAEFSDKESIKNTEAVDVVSVLGIIDGLPDGSYGPEQLVDRASMTKMITLALNGGTAPTLGTKPTPTFSDIKGTWAESFIEYCTSRGIVSGDGLGKFNPTGSITGSQAAKMLLVALGYDSDVFGFTGGNWEINVGIEANNAKLYAGLTIDASAPLSRDSAAQMIYNALNANIMERTYDKIQANGQVSYNYSLSESKTMLSEKFGVVKVEGVVMANEFVKLGDNSKALDAGKTTINVTNGSTSSGAGTTIDGDQNVYANGNKTFSVATGMEELGRSVTLYVKPYASNKANAEKGTVIGSVIVNTNNKVVVDTSKDTLADVADDNNLDLIFTVATGDSSTVTQVYNQFGTAAPVTDDKTAVTGAKADGTRGVERTLIDNDGDGEVEMILTNTYTVGKVTKYTTSGDGSITVKVGSYPAGTTGSDFVVEKSSKVVGFEDVAKDNIVVATVIGGKLHVAKAETVTGNLTAYKANASLTVDGTKYNVSGVGAYLDSDVITSNTPGSYGSASTLNNKATFYMDKFGNVAAVGGVEGSSNAYAFLWGTAGSGYGQYTAKVTLDDGTTSVYDLNTSKSGTLGYTTIKPTDEGKLYTYSINSDDEITLTAIAPAKLATDGSTAGTYQFSKGKSTLKAGSASLYADANTVFFAVSYKAGGSIIDSVDVYTGIASAPSINTATSSDIKSIVVKDGTSAKASVTFGATNAATGDFMYILSFNGTNENGDIYNAIVNGEIVNDIQTDTTYGSALVNTVQGYSMSGKNYYQPKGKPNNYAEGYVVKVTGNSVIVKVGLSDVEYLLNSGSVVATINHDDSAKTTLGDTLTKGDYIYVVDDGSSDKRIEGAYIIQTAEDDDARIAAIVTGATHVSKGTTTDYAAVVNSTGDEVKAELAIASGATIAVTDVKPAVDANGAYTLAGAQGASHTAGKLNVGTNYIVVVNDTSFNVYTLNVAAA